MPLPLQVCDVLRPDGELVVLIKPQFEAGKAQVCGCACVYVLQRAGVSSAASSCSLRNATKT